MRKTALYDKHVALGAKIVPFAGFEMPIVYSSITEEHDAVRNNSGLFDVSHMGEICIKGNEAEAMLNALSQTIAFDDRLTCAFGGEHSGADFTQAVLERL